MSRLKRRFPVTSTLLITLTVAAIASAVWFAARTNNGFDLAAQYEKHEYRVAMRDGAKLFTQVYLPKDKSRSYPFLIQRTPYGIAPYGEDRYRRLLGPSQAFDRAGYIFVFQDVRGRFQSEGEYVEARPHIDQPGPGDTDESTDMYDSVEWLLKNVPGNNGTAGVWGMSYPGFYAAASIVDSHPAIKAASPEAPVTNLFLGDDAYHNGAFMLAAQFEFYAGFFKPRLNPGAPEFPPANPGEGFDYGTRNGYEFFLHRGPSLAALSSLIHNAWFDQTIRHDTYDDYWKSRDISQHLHGIHCAILNTGGWFDAEDLAGALRTFRAIESQNPGISNSLVMGPWAHGDWLRGAGASLGPMKFGSATGEYFRDHIAFPFFEHHLKGVPGPNPPEAYAFETGTNQWRSYDAWPPRAAQPATLYFHAGGKLSFQPPAPDEAPFDEYVSDPANPVPYIANPSTELDSEYMYGEQTFASKRKDVLTFATEPLTEDTTLAGPVSPRLIVSASSTDSDYVVKLIDASPGYQLLVRGEPMRAKFRDSFSAPEPLKPNTETAVNFDMPDVNHTFLKGHRIMVQIQSSWFPLADLNPQRFLHIPDAQPTDFVRATERLFHHPGQTSRILIQSLPRH